MFGVIGDIHGNAWALEAVISDAHGRGVSEFVGLGDVLARWLHAGLSNCSRISSL